MFVKVVASRPNLCLSLETMAEKHPEKFVQVCASLMPKNVNLNVGIQDQLSELLERMQEIPPVTVNGEAAEIIENMSNVTHTVIHDATLGDNAKVINGLDDEST